MPDSELSVKPAGDRQEVEAVARALAHAAGALESADLYASDAEIAIAALDRVRAERATQDDVARPRAPFMHPDGRYVSVGVGNSPDSLLMIRGGDGDRERVEAWCNAVARVMADG